MLPVRLLLAVAFVFTVQLVDESIVHSAEESGRSKELVRRGLSAGLAGDSAGRRDKLEAALAIDPEAADAHWHLGHVRVGDEWKTVVEAQELARTDGKLNAYLKQRARYAGSVEGEARLGAWCQRNGLADQSRAHWYQVLRHDPHGKQGKKALVALDATWYRGTLLTKEQAEHQRRFDENLRLELRELKSQFESLRHSVLDGNAIERSLAMAELEVIRGNAGVVAITQVLLKPTSDAEQTARLQSDGMKLLGALDSSEAVRVLSWHATFSRHKRVRDVARKELARFPIHEYVPVLLAGMKMPIETAVSTSVLGTRTATTLTVSREGPGGQLYENQLQSYQSIGGSPTLAFDFGTQQVTRRPTSLVNM
jgi:hypothetical protein